VNLHLIQGANVEYGTIQESIAIRAWRKQQRIELYKTIATVTATVNAENAQKALRNLVEEMFPEVAAERERAVEKAMEIMEKEKNKSYKVTAVGSSMGKGSSNKIQSIMRQRRRPKRG
jgi:S-adenosylmethionine synthetase